MSVTKLNPDVVKEALKLQRKGWSLVRIAERFDVHPVNLSKKLSRVNRLELDKLARRRGAVRVQQAYQLEHVADEALQAWERSKLDAETIKIVDDNPKPEAATSRTETTIKSQSGDSSFLSEFRAALADIRKVLKIDDGTKNVNVSLGGKDGGPIEIAAAVVGQATIELETWRREIVASLSSSQNALSMPPTSATHTES